ncbi:hypothetical protein [Spirulina major]|uniref:hypothetical protein n=1 Tax=Spirulina major TaxID=270636 RepID=UPI00158795DC|nr:hypothetical protein [Spirulina major]
MIPCNTASIPFIAGHSTDRDRRRHPHRQKPENSPTTPKLLAAIATMQDQA